MARYYHCHEWAAYAACPWTSPGSIPARSRYNERFNLFAFWLDHRKVVPLHFCVYIADISCKKSSAANCEMVFSTAGKFAEEAKRTWGTSCWSAWSQLDVRL